MALLESIPLQPSDEPVDLGGRVVLVIGATGGLGTAVCEEAGARGAQLIAAGRQVVKLEKLADRIEAAGGLPPILFPVDLAGARSADYERMAAAIRAECGRLDAVIHTAAEFKGLTPLVHQGEERWRRTLTINLDARFLIDQACFPLLREHAGRVLHVVDDPARTARAYWGAYGVTQAGLQGLVSVEAAEFEGDGVAVAAVSVPPMRTRLRATAFVTEEVAQSADPATIAPRVVRLLAPSFRLAVGVSYAL